MNFEAKQGIEILWRKHHTRFRQHSDGFITEFGLLLVFAALAGLLDALSTIYVMLQFGPDVELHLSIRMLSWIIGPVYGPLAGKMIQLLGLLLVAVYFRRFARPLLLACTLLYFAAAIWNFVPIYLIMNGLVAL